MSDLISRQAAIDVVVAGEPYATEWMLKRIRALPSAQPERLTDDDFETIRIYLSAIKEKKLCNQHIWKEAEEYERLIERFMAFASTERPMGEWLARDCVFGVVYCSECGYELKQNDTHFCPNCGARMKGSGE